MNLSRALVASAAVIILLALNHIVSAKDVSASDAVASSIDNGIAPTILWVADQGGVIRVITQDGATQFELEDGTKPDAIAVDRVSAEIWVAGEGYVRVYTANGLFRAMWELPTDGKVSALAIDATGGAAWLSAGNEVFRIDRDTGIAGHVELGEAVTALTAFDEDEIAYVATGNTIYRLDAGMSVTVHAQSPEPIEPRMLEADGNAIWWLAGHTLYRSAGSDVQAVSTLPNNEKGVAISPDGADGLWMASLHSLSHVDATGTISGTALDPVSNSKGGKNGLGRVFDIAADPLDGGVWVAFNHLLRKFSASGSLLVERDFRGQSNGGRIEAITLYADLIEPSIHIVSPTEGSYISSDRPLLELEYSDVGAGLLPETVAMQANDADMSMSCNTAVAEADCQPLQPLAEGENTLQASITDLAGNIGKSSLHRFTVDTIPPVIDFTSPQNDGITNQPRVTVSGSVNEPAELELDSETVALDAERHFSVDVELQEGMNRFVFSAVDRADNTASAEFVLTLDTVAPAIPVQDSITIELENGIAHVTGASGSAEPGSLLVIRNERTGEEVRIRVNADGSFSAQIAAEAGDALNIFSEDAAGNISDTVEMPIGSRFPPDPADVAPPLSETAITPFHEAIEFIYSGPDPIQFDVEPETIEARRVVVLRGKVMTRDGEPLSGAKVTVNNHSEYGYTVSRADGAYDLAVNGGGHVTVTVEKEGFLPSQRTVKTPWRDYVIVDDIALVALDPEVTTINLSALTEIAVAQGSVVQDEDGQRQATILVPPGTSATMTLPDGTQQALSNINVRATEYTVGDSGPVAMPGDLPPTTAYTYAVELSVDEAISAGASRVDFSQPLPFYIDNFLDFPVGEVVPLGWYDRERAVWVPADNGKIVKIIDTDANGSAILDVDGNETPASAEQLADLGITDDERRNLANLHSVGKSLWRVQIDHFTPWDCNWPYLPPEDAIEPPDFEETPENDFNDNSSEETECSGCIIRPQSGTLGEAIVLEGTDFSLHYQSERADGFKRQPITIPLTEVEIPESLLEIELDVRVAGKRLSNRYPAASNLTEVFEWDGFDSYGRKLYGGHEASISVTYFYPCRYAPGPDGFGFPADLNVNPIRIGNRCEGFTTTRKFKTTVVSPFKKAYAPFGNWTINTYHFLDVSDGIIAFGDGRKRKVHGYIKDNFVETFAGGNPPQYPGLNSDPIWWDVSPALGERIHVDDIATAANGEVYYLASNGSYIGKIDHNKLRRHVTGNSGAGFFGDGGSAHNARVRYPEGITFDSSGNLYIADTGNHRIRKIDSEGIITTVAGSGPTGTSNGGYSGDRGPAIAARFDRPRDVAVDHAGNIFIADYGNNRIRKITPDGMITTIAGDGEPGGEGDGGNAIDATLHWPKRVSTDGEGNLYVVESNESRIRKITVEGRIVRFAGSGVSGFSGDGGPADAAKLYWPSGIAFDWSGNAYISDGANHRVRKVSKDKIISTIAGIGGSGTGRGGFSGDGGPAEDAEFQWLKSVASGPDGSFYLADKFNFRIRVMGGEETASGKIRIPSEDGMRVYVFNSHGIHLETRHALTGEILYYFTHDDHFNLLSSTDQFGNVTSIQKDTAAGTVTISHKGREFVATVNQAKFMEELRSPAGHVWKMSYTHDGLLEMFMDPNGNTDRFEYDSKGRLTENVGPVENGWRLSAASTKETHTVTLTSAKGRSHIFEVGTAESGERIYRDEAPDGTSAYRRYSQSGSFNIVGRNGEQLSVVKAADPRFGMRAPIDESVTIETPGGLFSEVTQQRTVDLADSNDIFSLETQTDIYSLNGKTRTVVFDAATRETTETSPEGRTSMVRINGKGRPELVKTGNLAETAYTYTPEGRIETITVGESVNARATTFSYYISGPSKGWLESVTDAEGRTTAYEYDLAGRVTKQTLPDLREIGYGYDANGNLTSITPPGRPAHEFTFTPVDMEDGYTPPDVLPGNDATDYAYNLDKQLELVTLPDGRTIDYVYGATTGKLNEIVVPTGSYGFGYKPGTGQLETLTAPGAEQLTYAYDGFLTTSFSSTGTINGTVSYGYNNDFRTQSLTINGDTVSFAYDDDGILTTAGSLTLVPDSANGFLDTTSLGLVTTDNDINAFGELGVFTATIAGSDIYSVDYQRDKLGRITRKTETIEDVTTTYDYTYDLAGRLDTVSENGIQTKDYDYDSNGNRTHTNGVSLGVYDDQDRMNAYGNCNYTYAENGELDTRDCGGSVLNVDYDVLGNLRRAELPNGDIIEYVIDGQNRRIGKKVNGALIQGFLYQDQLNPVAELDASGSVVARFVYAEKANVPSYMVKGGNTYRIISDHLGSPRLVIDTTTGDIVQRMDYDEWGNVLLDTNPGFQPFGFAGGIYDQHTGLVRFGARDYDPGRGRWTAKDPIGFDGGLNHYEYAFSDPINFIDTKGTAPAWVGITGGVMSSVGTGMVIGGLVTGNGPGVVAGAVIGTIGAGLLVYDAWSSTSDRMEKADDFKEHMEDVIERAKEANKEWEPKQCL